MDIKDEEEVGGYDADSAFPNGDAPEDDAPGWEAIWNAPDYSTLINARASRRAAEYTKKVNSVFKAGVFGCIQAGDMADAAAILHHGPPFSHALGQWADKDRRVAAGIDVVTSPSSPVMMALVTGITLLAQVTRNHEAQIREIPNARKRAKAIKLSKRASEKEAPPRFTIRVLKWQIPVRFRSRIKLSTIFAGFRAQTHEPQLLVMQVFNDPDLIKALEKQGIRLVKTDAPT
jgi:hypothetical protein